MMRNHYTQVFLGIAFALSNHLFAQDFKNQYNAWPSMLTCQRELNNGNYILLFSNQLMETNAEGTPTWTKEFTNGVIPLGVNAYLRCIQVTSDNGYIITGTYGAAGNNDIVLIKTDNAGIVTWSKSFGGLGDDNGIWVEQTSDGGYIIGGSKNVPLGMIPPNVHTKGDIYIIKTDNVGVVQWQTVLSVPSVGSAQNIKQTSDGGYIVTGNSGSEDAMPVNMYVIKLDNLGAITWQHQYNLACNAGIASSGREIWEIPGGYIVGGFVGGEVPGFKSKAVILKLDLAGNILDIGAFEHTLGGGGMTDLGFASLDVLANGEYIGCGGGYNDHGPLFLLKMNANLDMVWCKGYLSFVMTSATSIRENAALGFSLVDGTSSLLKTTNDGSIHCENPTSVFQSIANGAHVNLPTVVEVPGITSVLNVQTQPSFIGLNIICPEPLPIELVSFSGFYQNDENVLEWTTNIEVNNQYFTVEQSDDGITYRTIDIVDGAGNSNSVLSYHSFDKNPDPGINYYRLKQTDINGEFKYYLVISIDNSGNASLNVFPNPSTGPYTITLSGKATLYDIKIYDVCGNIIYCPQNIAAHLASVDLSGYKNGMYFMHMNIDGKELVEKLIIQH